MKERVIAQADTRVSAIALTVFFTLLMALGAYVKIPLFVTPVPFTLQTLVLYISIAVLKKRAYSSHLLYVILGSAGLGFFANAGAGFAYLLGPTGGYIMGFILAAFVCGRFFCAGKNFAHYVLFFSLAAAIVYACGMSWLMGIYGFNFTQALMAGFVPFILAEVIKIGLASLFALKYK